MADKKTTSKNVKTASTKTASTKSTNKNTVKKVNTDRKYLTALCIVGGIITLIDEDGEIKNFRQRGITNIPDNYKTKLIGMGVLNNKWFMFKELPKNISISYEDSSYLGRASATFPTKKLIDLLK